MNKIIIAVIVGFVAGTFTTGTIAFGTVEQCASDPAQGKNKGEPFLEIWAAICDLQNQINTIELTPGPQGEQGPPGPAGLGLSCANQEAIAAIIFDFEIDDECLPVDNDGDGYAEGVDCDDNNELVNPGAVEVSGNRVDDNCNGEIDEDTTPKPWDVVFLFDITGSMVGEINAFRNSFPTILDTIDTSSGGDYRIGFVTFGDGVTVLTPLTSDINTINNVVASLSTSSGEIGEASNEAKNTVINNLPAGQRDDVLGNTGTQTGDFDAPWRANAIKIAILMTDEGPSGFDITVDSQDVIQMDLLGTDAGALGIKFSDINTGGDSTVSDALEPDAINSGGLFRIAEDAQVVQAIMDIIFEEGGPSV